MASLGNTIEAIYTLNRKCFIIFIVTTTNVILLKKQTYFIMDPLLGEIKLFAGDFAPRGWLFCDGQLLSIASNSALFSILGTFYGGDGRTTFALPDLRGRVAIGPRNSPGLSSYRLGQKGGEEQVTLNLSQIPSHKHDLRATNNLGNSNTPYTNILANTGDFDSEYSTSSPNTVMSADAISSTGGGLSHENRQPYLSINYIIAVAGIYPSRS